MLRSLGVASLNFILPGLAQFRLGQTVKAVIAFVGVTLCFFSGLCLDLDYYFRYRDIKRKVHTLEFRPGAEVGRPSSQAALNPLSQHPVVFDFLPVLYGEASIVLSGSTKPLLALEVVNQTNGMRVQVQADYRGHFTMPPIQLAPGPNELVYGAANDWLIPLSGQSVHIADYDMPGRYQPSKLEKLWHFIYQVIFPALLTPFFFLAGSAFQPIIGGWWEVMPLVQHAQSMPASLRDVGFYLIVLAAMLNLIALFDAYDTAYNAEVIDGLP